MAKISMGGIGITQISGKIGGHVVSKNNRLRVKAIPSNPRSATQLVQRGRMTTFAQGWAGLTEAQRQAWETTAASGDWKFTDNLGNSFNPSGENLYTTLNLNLKTIGASAINTPPTKVATPVLSVGAVTLSAAGTFDVEIVGTLGTAHTLVFTTSSQLSPGRMKNPKSSNRFVVASATGGTVDILAEFEGLFGAPVQGKKVFGLVEVIAEATGQRSIVGGFNEIVTA